MMLNIVRKQGMPEHSLLSIEEFRHFCSPVLKLKVSHIWRGIGSALFLELGELSSRGARRDGTPRNPAGQVTLSIEWSWRIESKRLILCGSWSDEDRWERVFAFVRGQEITSLELFGRLPELDIGLKNGCHLVSLMTSEGDPQWCISSRADAFTRSVEIVNGRIVLSEERNRYA